MCPLPFLSPVPCPEQPESATVQAENETSYRQLLVYAVLAILLPTEDLENGCLTALVGQIFSELIIGNAVANKLSEPWLIWELFIIVSRTVGRRTVGEGEKGPLVQPRNASLAERKGFSVQALFWTVIQWCFLAVTFVRAALAIVVTSGSLPPRTDGADSHKIQHDVGKEPLGPVSSLQTDPRPSKTPLFAFRCWSAISNLIELNTRMPWLCGALSMMQWIGLTGPGRIAGLNGKLDR